MYALLGIFFLLAGGVGLICYVLSALGLMRVGRYLGYGENSWMAWIPIVNMYYLALISSTDEEKAAGTVKMYNQLEVPLLLYNLGCIAVTVISSIIASFGITAILSVVITVGYYGFVYYRVYTLLNNADPYDNNNSYMPLGIVSAFIGLIPMVYFLQSRFNSY